MSLIKFTTFDHEQIKKALDALVMNKVPKLSKGLLVKLDSVYNSGGRLSHFLRTGKLDFARRALSSINFKISSKVRGERTDPWDRILASGSRSKEEELIKLVIQEGVPDYSLREVVLGNASVSFDQGCLRFKQGSRLVFSFVEFTKTPVLDSFYKKVSHGHHKEI